LSHRLSIAWKRVSLAACRASRCGLHAIGAACPCRTNPPPHSSSRSRRFIDRRPHQAGQRLAGRCARRTIATRASRGGSLRLDGRTVAVSGRPKSDNDRARVVAALSKLPSGYTSTVLLERLQEVAAPAPNVVVPATPPRPPIQAPQHAAAPASKPIAASYKTAQPRAAVTGSVSGACRRRSAMFCRVWLLSFKAAHRAFSRLPLRRWMNLRASPATVRAHVFV